MTTMSPILLLLMPFLLPSQPTVQPTPAQAMYSHVPRQASFVLGLDTSSLLPHLLHTAQTITQHPAVRKNPHTRRMIARGWSMFTMQHARFSKMLGYDPTKAIKSVTLSITDIPKSRKKRILVAIYGTFPRRSTLQILARIFNSSQKTPQRMGDFTYISFQRGRNWVGGFSKGPLFMGPKKDLLHFLKTGELEPKKHNAQSVVGQIIQTHKRSLLSVGVEFSKFPKLYRKMRRIPLSTVRTLVQKTRSIHLNLGYKQSHIVAQSTDPQARKTLSQLMKSTALFATSGVLAGRGLLTMLDALISTRDQRMLPMPIRLIVEHKKEIFKALYQKMGTQVPTHTIRQTARQVHLMLRGSTSVSTLLLPILMAGGYFSFLKTRPRRVRSIPLPHTRRSRRP